MGDTIIKVVLDRFRVSLLFQSHFFTFLISLLTFDSNSLFTFNSRLDKQTSFMINTVSSANRRVSKSEALGRSFTYNENNVGPRMDPCGTPVDIFSKCEDTLLTLTYCFLISMVLRFVYISGLLGIVFLRIISPTSGLSRKRLWLRC